MELLEISKYIDHTNTAYVQTTLLFTMFLCLNLCFKSPKTASFLKFLNDKKLIGWLFKKEFFNGIINTFFNFIIYFISVMVLAIIFSRPLNIELTDKGFKFFITGLTIILNIMIALPIYVLLYAKIHEITFIQMIKKIVIKFFSSNIFDKSKLLFALLLIPFNYEEHYHLSNLILISAIIIIVVFFIFKPENKRNKQTDSKNKK